MEKIVNTASSLSSYAFSLFNKLKNGDAQLDPIPENKVHENSSPKKSCPQPNPQRTHFSSGSKILDKSVEISDLQLTVQKKRRHTSTQSLLSTSLAKR